MRPSRRTTIWSAWWTVETRWEIRIVVRCRGDFVQAAQDALLGVGIHAGKGIVENQDARIAKDGAGQGGALLLAAGKRDAALADHGVVSGGEAR